MTTDDSRTSLRVALGKVMLSHMARRRSMEDERRLLLDNIDYDPDEQTDLVRINRTITLIENDVLKLHRAWITVAGVDSNDLPDCCTITEAFWACQRYHRRRLQEATNQWINRLCLALDPDNDTHLGTLQGMMYEAARDIKTINEAWATWRDDPLYKVVAAEAHPPEKGD